MYNGLLHLHNLLRWIILILLLINIVRHISKAAQPLTAQDKKLGLWLLIASHITLLLGLYQYFTGPVGFKVISHLGFAEVMKNNIYRFWAVEHITGMLIAIALITVGYSAIKKNITYVVKRRRAAFLFLAALIIILLVVPWPFREGIGRPWFPGMH